MQQCTYFLFYADKLCNKKMFLYFAKLNLHCCENTFLCWYAKKKKKKKTSYENIETGVVTCDQN